MICLGTNEGRHSEANGPTQVRYDKGEPIYSQGDPCHYWFEVVSGVVRTCHFHADGHRQLTGFFYCDDVFGLDLGDYPESAEAVTAVRLRRHARADASTPVEGHSQEMALRRALQSAQECIFLLGHRTAAERVAAFLVAMKDRAPAGTRFAVPMSRADIADHLGLTIHTVSRTISDLGRRRLIAFDTPHEVKILEVEKLRELAGECPGHFDGMRDPEKLEDQLGFQAA